MTRMITVGTEASRCLFYRAPLDEDEILLLYLQAAKATDNDESGNRFYFS